MPESFIRPASLSDRSALRALYESAFPKEEAPLVTRLALDLLEESSEPPVLSLVLCEGEHLLAHVAFSPAPVEALPDLRVWILAPLAVQPERQKQGHGSALVREGLKRMRGQRCDVLMVYGDPEYYGRFGFGVEGASLYRAPYPLQMLFGWQCMEMSGRPAPEKPLQLRCVPALQRPELW